MLDKVVKGDSFFLLTDTTSNDGKAPGNAQGRDPELFPRTSWGGHRKIGEACREKIGWEKGNPGWNGAIVTTFKSWILWMHTTLWKEILRWCHVDRRSYDHPAVHFWKVVSLNIFPNRCFLPVITGIRDVAFLLIPIALLRFRKRECFGGEARNIFNVFEYLHCQRYGVDSNFRSFDHLISCGMVWFLFLFCFVLRVRSDCPRFICQWESTEPPHPIGLFRQLAPKQPTISTSTSINRKSALSHDITARIHQPNRFAIFAIPAQVLILTVTLNFPTSLTNEKPAGRKLFCISYHCSWGSWYPFLDIQSSPRPYEQVREYTLKLWSQIAYLVESSRSHLVTFFCPISYNDGRNCRVVGISWNAARSRNFSGW